MDVRLGPGRAEPPRPAEPARERRPSARDRARREVGRFLRRTREDQQLTQQEVAALTRELPWGISRAGISAIERGENFPGLEAILGLSRVLHFDPHELLECARLWSVAPADAPDDAEKPGAPGSSAREDDLERRASDALGRGDDRVALALFDRLLEGWTRALSRGEGPEPSRIAALELRRATCLHRVGAPRAAVAALEHAIRVAAEEPADVRAEAHALLASVRCRLGHLPLADDAARRAVDLAAGAGARIAGRAWLSRGQVDFAAGRVDAAREAFERALERLRDAGDAPGRTHALGNIGECWNALGDLPRARDWISRAIESAREGGQVLPEASWTVTLGRVALAQGRAEEARGHARAALRLAREHSLTAFRAHWLLREIGRRRAPQRSERRRMALLRALSRRIEHHEGIDELREFRRLVRRARNGDSS